MKRLDTELHNVPRLTRKERAEAGNLSDTEIRFIVSNYYESQGARKRSDQQIATLGDRPVHTLTRYLANRYADIEGDMKAALNKATDSRPIGQWMKANVGIGPIVAAGLLAHIDIFRCPTVGHIWSFAGLNPEQKWNKGEKRPHNAALKTICWHAGQGFLKTSNNPQSFYGAVYRDRKAYEIARNESGGNAETAVGLLSKFNKSTEAHKHLKAGVLPPAHIDARARRYAVKLFLSHLHLVWFWLTHGELPPKPYILTRGHAHMIVPPRLDLVPELEQALTAWGNQ